MQSDSSGIAHRCWAVAIETEAKIEARGEIKGKSRINALYSWLHENHRDDEIWKAITDSEYRSKLLKEFDEASCSAEEISDQNV